MDNLSKEELVQFVNYYRQRSSDLELQNLQLQVKFNKLSGSIESEDIKKVSDKNKK